MLLEKKSARMSFRLYPNKIKCSMFVDWFECLFSIAVLKQICEECVSLAHKEIMVVKLTPHLIISGVNPMKS